MKGKILDFSLQRSSGIISADNGSRYDFHISEWRENATPERGMLVDFGVNNENHAVAIYLEQEVQEIKPTRAMQPEKRIKPETFAKPTPNTPTAEFITHSAVFPP